MNVYFKWTQNNQNTIEFKAASGLVTDPAVGRNSKVYSYRWKLPNCHFFKRYMPSEWSFSLVFDPNYPANDTFKPMHSSVVALGPKQTPFTIPISVSFNATAMEDSHHKGC